MSSRFNFAASRLINPLGVSLKLTQAQVWKGLCMKVREPQHFVSGINSCEIVSESGNKVVRNITVGNGLTVMEEIEMDEPSICYFESGSAETRIINVVSYTAEDELLLTFSFVNGIPGYDPGSETPSERDLNKVVGAGIQKTIDRIRELVIEGAIQ